jgi:hypothetical protein
MTTDPFDPNDPFGTAPLDPAAPVDYTELLGGNEELGGLLNDTYGYIEETEAWMDSFDTGPGPVVDPVLDPAAPVDYTQLTGGDEELGGLLNDTYSYLGETDAWVDSLAAAPPTDPGVDLGQGTLVDGLDAPLQDQGFGINTAAGQALNIVNTHLSAADDALHGDFAATERIAGWTPFLSAHNAGQDAWDGAMSTYRDPFEKLVETNVSQNEYAAWQAEVEAIRNAGEVTITAQNAESRAAWAVWVSQLLGALTR